MTLRFHPLDTATTTAARQGAPDANGQPAELVTSGGPGFPCRNCLHLVPKGDDMLVLAARPFETLHPYAETGPIFLCAADCPTWREEGLPPVLTVSPTYLLKGYGHDDRIVYGTGKITEQAEITSTAEALLSRADIAYVDVRSATNNCWLARITEKQ